jgi:Kef-type K+ transport system membrane component KefB
VGLLSSPWDWATCVAIVLLACAGKFAGTALGARLAGVPWNTAAPLGILMNTRGLMELVVLNIGLDLGIISPLLFTMMIVMAIATTVATTPLLEWTARSVPASERAGIVVEGDSLPRHGSAPQQ